MNVMIAQDYVYGMIQCRVSPSTLRLVHHTSSENPLRPLRYGRKYYMDILLFQNVYSTAHPTF